MSRQLNVEFHSLAAGDIDHPLCRDCDHDMSCSSVCIAIEILVQLSKVRSPMAQLEYVYNVSTKLDIENSFTAEDL